MSPQKTSFLRAIIYLGIACLPLVCFTQKISQDLHLLGKADQNYQAFDSYETFKIIDDHVMIKAIARHNTVKLTSKLQKKGLKNISTYGGVISGLLPISAINDLNNIGSLKFAQIASERERTDSEGEKLSKNCDSKPQKPKSGTVQLVMQMQTDNTYELELVDMIGETIMERAYASRGDETRTFLFDFTDLRTGWYFLRINDGKGDFRSYPIRKE